MLRDVSFEKRNMLLFQLNRNFTIFVLFLKRENQIPGPVGYIYRKSLTKNIFGAWGLLSEMHIRFNFKESKISGVKNVV